jgi:hypothetical protein
MVDKEYSQSLRRLAAICPPPSSPVALERAQADREGQVLPEDHRALTQAYGPGCFDEFLWVFAVGAENKHLDVGECSRELRSLLQRRNVPLLKEVLREHDAGIGDLVQWGVTDNADILAWIARGPAGSWPTVIIQAGQLDAVVTPRKYIEVLLDLLTGSMRVRFFPADFPSDRPEFSVNPYS